MEIVYCGGCGKALLKDEFTRGHARFLDNRPWCAECKPPDKQQISSGAHSTASIKKVGSSAKHARIKGSAPAPAAPNKALLIGVGAGAVVLVLVAALVASNSGGPSAPLVDRVVKPPVVPPPQNDEAPRLLRDLESIASLAPPDRILARCGEIRSKLRGTPEEKRFLQIEASARDLKKSRDQDVQFSRDLEALNKLIEEDPRFERFEEVLNRIRAVKEIAGTRAPELDRRLADYQKARQSSPTEKHGGPFESDEQGYVRHWLFLGPFPNDKDQGIDVDFLKTEAACDPVAGAAVGNLKWGAFASAEAKIDFYKVTPLALKKPSDNVVCYAACLLQVPGDVAASFRFGSDDGGALWVDGRQAGKVHKSRAYKAEEDRYAIPLAPGLHRVLIKVDNHQKSFEFGLRVVGPDGLRVPGLRVWN